MGMLQLISLHVELGLFVVNCLVYRATHVLCPTCFKDMLPRQFFISLIGNFNFLLARLVHSLLNLVGWDQGSMVKPLTLFPPRLTRYICT